MSRPYIDITGQTFGRLIVIEHAGLKNHVSYWMCKCTCGNIIKVRYNNLTRGTTKSCGCLVMDTRIKHGKANFYTVYNSYINKAAKRNLNFDLTESDFIEITQQPCYYCGTAPSNMVNKCKSVDTFIYNGIDRWDNTLGYIKSNCVPCCKTCNYAKNTMTADEYKTWLIKAYKYMENKNNE